MGSAGSAAYPSERGRFESGEGDSGFDRDPYGPSAGGGGRGFPEGGVDFGAHDPGGFRPGGFEPSRPERGFEPDRPEHGGFDAGRPEHSGFEPARADAGGYDQPHFGGGHRQPEREDTPPPRPFEGQEVRIPGAHLGSPPPRSRVAAAACSAWTRTRRPRVPKRRVPAVPPRSRVPVPSAPTATSSARCTRTDRRPCRSRVRPGSSPSPYRLAPRCPWPAASRHPLSSRYRRRCQHPSPVCTAGRRPPTRTTPPRHRRQHRLARAVCQPARG
ncbi:hypothetical protein ACFQ1L_04910 [Phytohabitans flavus]|uniref:hypothetical protein n=1 Tax=Phytohabitans flavus TaxID=1076124 RepID=UPI0036313F20